MKDTINDIKECFKISFKVFFISFIVGIIIGIIAGLVKNNFNVLFLPNLIFIAEWGSRLVTYAACFGLFIAAVSFIKKDLMRPLDYQKQWRTYFIKFNLAHVVFFVALFCLLYSLILTSILFYF